MNILMTPEEYQDFYSEAVRIVRNKFEAVVGSPYVDDGIRICDISGLPATDRTVFLLAWGPKVADRITSEASRFSTPAWMRPPSKGLSDARSISH